MGQTGTQVVLHLEKRHVFYFENWTVPGFENYFVLDFESWTVFVVVSDSQSDVVVQVTMG